MKTAFESVGSTKGDTVTEKLSKTTSRDKPVRRPYARPTLVKRDKLGKVTAADTVTSGIVSDK